jgi:hypothetical protein
MKLKNRIINHRKILSSILVLAIAVFAFHLAVNYLDIKMVVINPNEENTPEETTLGIYYDFPPSGPDGPHITLNENGTFEGLPLFSLTITYSYEGILAEGTDFFITASGSLYPEGQETIDKVEVGYEEAIYADGSFRNYPPLFNASLYPSECYTMQIPPQGSVWVLPIKWTSTGDYYPYLVVTYKNGSDTTTVNISDGKVHVFGRDTLLQDEYNRKQASSDRRNRAIMVDLGAIGFCGPLLGYILRIKPDKKTHSSRRQRYAKGYKKRKP